MCGTAPWEWDEKQGGSRFAYEPVEEVCPGCEKKDWLRDDEEGATPGGWFHTLGGTTRVAWAWTSRRWQSKAAMSGTCPTAAREVSVLLSANTGPYQQEMQKALRGPTLSPTLSYKVEHAYKGALKFIGSGMIGIGASMQGAATGAVWSAAQFEESFARVAKTTGLENTLGGTQPRR
jgi:hypothetical protein